MKSHKKGIIFITILLVLLGFILLLMNIKGPIITVNNCNENLIKHSNVCCDEDTYYFVSNGDIICFNSNQEKRVFFDEFDVQYVACNDRYVYAVKEKEIIKLDLNGDIVDSIDTGLTLEGIFSDEDCIIYVSGGIYFLIASDDFHNISISEFLGSFSRKEIQDHKLLVGSKRTIISQAPTIDINSNKFIGIVMLDNITLNLSYDKTIGYYDRSIYKYYTQKSIICLNETYEDLVIESSQKLDTRHITLDDNMLMYFYSDYSKNSLLKPFYKTENRYPPDSIGFLEENTLLFHSYDEVIQRNLINGVDNKFRTKAGEKIIYLCSDKMITYYKGDYLVYSPNDWTVINSVSANEIKNGGSYTFETCGEYIFVFDDNTGELLNTISVA